MQRRVRGSGIGASAVLGNSRDYSPSCRTLGIRPACGAAAEVSLVSGHAFRHAEPAESSTPSGAARSAVVPKNHYNARQETHHVREDNREHANSRGRPPAHPHSRPADVDRDSLDRDGLNRDSSDRDASDQGASRSLPHIGLVGDTYTITVSGQDTAGRFCVIDMHIPPAAGLRRTGMISKKRSSCSKANWKPRSAARSPSCGRARRSMFPSNAPHQFHNASSQPVRLLCVCSPAGLDEFFLQSESPSPPVPRLLPSSMRNNRLRLWRRRRPSHPSTGLSSWRRLRRAKVGHAPNVSSHLQLFPSRLGALRRRSTRPKSAGRRTLVGARAEAPSSPPKRAQGWHRQEGWLVVREGWAIPSGGPKDCPERAFL